MKKYTLIWWLKQLPSEYREHALQEYSKNYCLRGLSSPDRLFPSFSAALFSAFPFPESSQGFKYWDRVYGRFFGITMKTPFTNTLY